MVSRIVSASVSNIPQLYRSVMDLCPTKWCFAVASSWAVGAAVPIRISLKNCLESAETIGASKCFEMDKLVLVLPTPVGPRSTIKYLSDNAEVFFG